MSVTFDMPESYRDIVPVNSVNTNLPGFPTKRYMWPFAKADWADSNLRPLIDWATRKNCMPSVNMENVGIPVSGGGVASGSQREIVTDINGAYDSQVLTSVMPQDIIPTTRMDRVIPQSTQPHLVPQAKWDEQDQFLRDSCDRYWTDLGLSNATSQEPSIVIVNCIETTGSFSWYTTFRNADATGLSAQEKRDWDDAMAAFYIRSYDIFREYFPVASIVMYTTAAYGWDGQRGRERMPEKAAQMYVRTLDNYQLANTEWNRRRFIKQIQDIDRQYSGENQRGFKTLLPGTNDNGVVTPECALYMNPGPERSYQLEFRTWIDSRDSTEIPNRIVEHLSYAWYDEWLTSWAWAGTQHRLDEQLYIPNDRIQYRLYWPTLFGIEKSDWYFMARLAGANNIKTELVLQPAM